MPCVLPGFVRKMGGFLLDSWMQLTELVRIGPVGGRPSIVQNPSLRHAKMEALAAQQKAMNRLAAGPAPAATLTRQRRVNG